MNSLEEVYLANVVLYFTTIETAINFIYVNSKCRDALEILRMNPNFELIQQKDPFCILRNYEIFKKELQLFPNLETIQYSSESLRFHEYMKHLNCKIKLPTWYDKTYINHTTFFQYYKHNLVELSMNSNDLYIDQFPSLQRLTIIITPTRFNCRFHLTDCINTSIHKIKYLKIYIISSNFYSLQTMDFITEMKTLNIENSIVHFSSKKDYQRIIDIPNVFNYITLCSSYYFDGIDPRVVILSNLSHTFEIESQLNKNIIETYFNQYLPINVVIKSRNIYDLDLRSLTYIKHIDNQIGLKQITFPSSLTSLIDQNQPSNCPYLKELILNHCNQQQITSSTITKLTCKHCSFEHLNCSQLEHLSLFQTQFVNVIDCCNTLTYLEIHTLTIECSFQLLQSLQILVLSNCIINYNLNHFYPTSLKILRCDQYDIPISIDNIIELHLSFSNKQISRLNSMKQVNHSVNLSMYTSLTKLTFQHLGMNTFKLPTSVKKLHLVSINDSQLTLLNFIQYTTITEITFNICFNISTFLPRSLKSLAIHRCFLKIINENQLHLESLILESNKMEQHFTHIPKNYYISKS